VHITVSRRSLLTGLCQSLDKPSSSLRKGIDVRFAGDGESGVGDGHRREFFQLAASELMDPNCGLFKSHDGGRSFHISGTAAAAQPDHLAQFELCGKLVGLALLHRETLPSLRFTDALRKLLLRQVLTIEDMASVDPEFYAGKVQYVLESRYKEGPSPMALEDLCLTFEDAPQPDVFPHVKEELCPGGGQTKVTEDNKQHYIWLLVEHRLRASVSTQLEALMKGFGAVVPPDEAQRIARVLTSADLGVLLRGVEELDVNDWKTHSVQDEGVAGKTWEMFWKVVEAMTDGQRNGLLAFVTGSPTLPAGGFRALPGYGGPEAVARFTLSPPARERAAGTGLGLPTAATCFNKLYLPAYETEAEMRSALLEAIAHRGSGFHEGAVAA